MCWALLPVGVRDVTLSALKMEATGSSKPVIAYQSRCHTPAGLYLRGFCMLLRQLTGLSVQG